MTSLFLLGATWDESPTFADLLIGGGMSEEATIVALDFWAGKKLRKAHLEYQTPRDYLTADPSRELDVLAANLARTWYGAGIDRLRYNGIHLCQVAEYDFTFLFIDALRSVEIGHRIFENRNLDRVFLTPQLPRTSSPHPNGICYESLPGVVEELAGGRNLPVTWSGTPTPLPRVGGGPSSFARRNYSAAKAIFWSWAAKRRGTVLFMQIPSFVRVAAAMDREGPFPINLAPMRVGRREARRRAMAFRTLWKELERDSAFRKALTINEVPLSEVLAPRFQGFFEAVAPRLIEWIEGAEWLIRRLRPRLLVVQEDLTPISRAISQVFRRHGLPILVLQHGAVSGDVGGFHVMPLEAERQAVWGTIPRDWHVKRGKPSNSQVITGNPSFDSVAVGYEPKVGDLRRRLGLEPGKGLILVATEWFAGNSVAATIDDEDQFIRYTLKALKELSGYQVAVKLHPNYQAQYERLVRSIAEEEKVQVIIAKGALWDLLALADLVIVSNSTVGLEAMMLGTPVLVVETNEGLEMVPYVASGAAFGASMPEEIVAAAKKALGEESLSLDMERSRKAFIQGYAHIQDGRASERVAQLIGKMILPAP